MATREIERNVRVELWLRQPEQTGQGHRGRGAQVAIAGGTVIAANDRAARALLTALHAGRQQRGLDAWETPAIFAWDAWVRERWVERNASGSMLLNSLQEHALWVKLIRKSETGAALLHPDRLATAAQQAYQLLADYSPGSMQAAARAGWSGDPAVFNAWMTEFDSVCRRDNLVSASRLANLLTRALLEKGQRASIHPWDSPRPRLLLVGFDRLLDSQKQLVDAWGEWQLDEDRSDANEHAESTRFLRARDSSSELAACAGWLRERLHVHPECRLLVIAPNLDQRRGELERALLETSTQLQAAGANLDFEFSLGVPLNRVGVARSALLLLRWLAEPLLEPEVDWILTCGHATANTREEIQLARAMQSLRGRGLERPAWPLADLLKHTAADPDDSLKAWSGRMTAAREQLTFGPALQSPLAWVELTQALLATMGWPGGHPESSAAFQARERWHSVLESCGSLGYDGSAMDWSSFVSTLAQAMSMTIFATESAGARIQVSQPLESAGQLADGIWFLGAQEQDWPGRGNPHPLLPIGLQRDAGMPHSSPAADWKLAQQATQRLLASADEVVFSYAELAGETECRPSRLIMKLLNATESVIEKVPCGGVEERVPLTECFEDTSQIPYLNTKIAGGSATLTSQSLCPFKAFGIARLDAETWQAAETGLNARQRGQLLHETLRRVWGGTKKGGISTSVELAAIEDLRGFVRPLAENVLAERSSGQRRNGLAPRFPERYLRLEVERLTRLVAEWLAYEQSRRLPFEVVDVEGAAEGGHPVTVAGLTLDLRMDRVDKLADGSRLIIDYKSGNLGPSAWAGDRPDDVQLPLYATFAFDERQQTMQGLVFGRVKAGGAEICGRVFDAPGSLMTGLNGRNGLIKDPLTQKQLADWRALIEHLGEDFLNGRADVDPKAGAKTCDRCHLHAVCRIYESQPLAIELSGIEDEDAESSVGEEVRGA